MTDSDRYAHAAKYLMTNITKPHEDDFYFFKNFEGDDGLIVDVGANVGQSVISFRLLNKTFKIHSFEPNTALEPAFAFLKSQLGDSFEYTMCGLGNKNEKRKLIIPICGDIDLSHSCSLDAGEFEKKWVVERLSKDTEASAETYSFDEQEVDIRVFDELGYVPTIIKIDVEGWEHQVLLGMKETIGQHRPIIMLEMNNISPVASFLHGLGYHGFGYDHLKNQLTNWEWGNWAPLNLFYFHRSKITELKTEKKEISWGQWTN